LPGRWKPSGRVYADHDWLILSLIHQDGALLIYC
jgi:hypothetical protein